MEFFCLTASRKSYSVTHSLNNFYFYKRFIKLAFVKVMELLLSSQVKGEELAEDDPQMSYMISAWARICKILGARFAPYLPLVMGPVMKTASLKPEVAMLDNDELNGVEEENDDWQFVQLGEQQNFGIKTAGLEDKATACQMLVCYAR